MTACISLRVVTVRSPTISSPEPSGINSKRSGKRQGSPAADPGEAERKEAEWVAQQREAAASLGFGVQLRLHEPYPDPGVVKTADGR